MGVVSRSDLEKIGVVGAFNRVRDAGFSPSLNLLYALAGALIDVHWTELTPELKASLRSSL